MRQPIAIPVRRLSWSVSIHFVAIHCSSVLQPKIAEKLLNQLFGGFKVVQGR